MSHYTGLTAFLSQAIEQKIPLFSKDDRIFDVIYAKQFNQKTLYELFALADAIRHIAKTQQGSTYLRSLLSDKRAMLFFVQPSTRTFMSFLNACHLLGMKTSEIRDSSTSSEVKGESSEDSIRTFSSYVDMIITRHHDAGFAETASWVLNTHANRSIPIINGGSGKDQHPTQALLDMYTIHRTFKERGGFEGKTYTFVGDLKRGRTVRSLTELLALYSNIHLRFVSPKAFAMQEDILTLLKAKKISYEVTEDFEQAITNADVIYATRIQDEHDIAEESKQSDFTKFHLTKAHLPLLKKDCIILHPFPRRYEIDVAIDNDPRAMYWKQARNGMWIRAALILYLFRRDHLVDWFI